ncbi:hypothetical protein KXV89_000507, partial [Aspergillus fumigatus]
ARARRPTGHLWRLPCPSGCLSTRCRSLARAGQLVTPGACECVARPASVHGARPCLPAAGLPPTGRRALACAPPPPPPPRPPRPPRPPFVALARATLCSPRGRAPTGPPAPLNRLPSTGTLARAAGGPSPTHTHRPRPAHHRARKRSRVRTSFRGEAHLRRQTARRPCGHVPQPTGHCPS